MSLQCTVCGHKDVGKINKRLVEGVSLSVLAKTYGLAKTSLHRHKAHVPTSLAKARNAKEITSAGGLMERVADLNGKAEDVYRRALKEANYTAAIAAVRNSVG